MDDKETQKRLERMRLLLRPISHERAQEIANGYITHMREKVEQAGQKRKSGQAAETEEPNSTDEL